MINKPNKNEVRQKRHLRIRSRIQGSASRPRLSVYRSTCGIYAQIIDDETGCTLVSCSTIAKGMDYSSMNKTEAAAAVGEAIAKRALEKGIDTVVFDRGGYLYTGRVKALADGARSGGLKF